MYYINDENNPGPAGLIPDLYNPHGVFMAPLLKTEYKDDILTHLVLEAVVKDEHLALLPGQHIRGRHNHLGF